MHISEIEKIVCEAKIDEKYKIVLAKEPELDKTLSKIYKHYKTKKLSYSQNCETTAKNLLMAILSDNDLKEIHSARYRTKSIDSLITKYIKKKALLPEIPSSDYNIEKYRLMDSNNYYKIITDLIGIRILIRYQQQWEIVHRWIWDNFYKSQQAYIKNWIDDYPSGIAEDFLAEKPKLYLRTAKDLPLYEKFGKDIFESHISEEGYCSIHYLLWHDGKYIEIQVRTIYDEAWGECTHDLVYKCKNKSRRNDLERLSTCLATQTQAAEMIADMMYEKSITDSTKTAEPEPPAPKNTDLINEQYNRIQKRILNMKQSEAQPHTFNGSIDDIL